VSSIPALGLRSEPSGTESKVEAVRRLFPINFDDILAVVFVFCAVVFPLILLAHTATKDWPAAVLIVLCGFAMLGSGPLLVKLLQLYEQRRR